MGGKSDVGTLTVYLSAVTGKFDAGLKNAETRIKGFKGKITGLGSTFTELQSKLSLVAAAAEIVFGGAAAVIDVFKGDWESAAEKVKSLPILGGVATQMEKFVLSATGVGDALKKQEELTIAGAVAMKKLAEEWVKFHKAMTDAQKGIQPLADQILVLEEHLTKGAEAAAKLQAEISNEAAIEALEAQMDMNDMLITDKQKRAAVNSQILKQIEMLMKVQRLGKEVAKTTEDQAKAAEDLTKADEKRLSMNSKLTSLQEKRTSVAGGGIRSTADSFSTPMGSISLPSMSTAVELAKRQVDELRKIDEEIKALRTDIKALAA